MTSMAGTYFTRFLRVVARLVCRHPNWFVFPQLAVFAICVAYTFSALNFDMNQDNMVGAGEKAHQVYMQFKKEFPGEDELVVVVESEDLERNRQFVERLAARLSARLEFADMDEPLGPGVLLGAVVEDCSRIHHAIYETFVAYPLEERLPA